MKQWFVVQSKPRREAVAEVNLERQGFETYWPRIVQSRRSRGKWRKVIEPLFPRYLFVRLEQGRDDFAPIRSTTGVKELVCFGGVPKILQPEIIEETAARGALLQYLQVRGVTLGLNKRDATLDGTVQFGHGWWQRALVGVGIEHEAHDGFAVLQAFGELFIALQVLHCGPELFQEVCIILQGTVRHLLQQFGHRLTRNVGHGIGNLRDL